MSGFALGFLLGCLAGALGVVVLLLVVYHIPDGEYVRSRIPDLWRGLAIGVLLVAASGAAFAVLNLQRVAFATTVLLGVVVVAARVEGMLASWVTLGAATLALCIILPPAQTLDVADPQDRILLLFFVLCGAVATRLVAPKQRA